MIIIACVLLIALILANSCAKRDEPDVPPVSESDIVVPPPASPTDVQPPSPAPEDSAPTTAPEDSLPVTVEPAPIPVEPDPVEETPAHGTVACFDEPVEDEWFSDAAFLGNSLVDGFRLFSGLTTCDYYAATSMTVLGADGLISQMAAKQYGKVYILLGINEIGYDAGVFKDQYASMLDTIAEQQPDADIYIMGLSPVSEYKSSTDSTFTMERVRLYNEKLAELAVEKDCYYIDLVEALADETGYLPAAVTSDGVHFAASHYLVWLDYLRTHHA